MPTWHGLVYFIRLLAQLRRSSTRHTHCWLSKRVKKNKKKIKGQLRRSVHLTCSVSRVTRAAGAPHGRRWKALLPSVVGTVSPFSSTSRNEWRELARAHYWVLHACAHMYIRLVLFISSHVPSAERPAGKEGLLFKNKFYEHKYCDMDVSQFYERKWLAWNPSPKVPHHEESWPFQRNYMSG